MKTIASIVQCIIVIIFEGSQKDSESIAQVTAFLFTACCLLRSCHRYLCADGGGVQAVAQVDAL